MSDFPKAELAVVGGTHLNDYVYTTDLLEGAFVVETGAGDSPKIHFGYVDRVPFYYVHFHGEGKWLETWLALRDLGVKNVIGGGDYWRNFTTSERWRYSDSRRFYRS